MVIASWWPDVFPSFEDLLKWFRDAIVTGFEWLWSWFEPVLTPLWEALELSMNAVAAGISLAQSHLETLRPYIAYANAWVPVDVAITLIVAYSAFWLALVVYRSVKKWIPTVSG